MSRHPHLSVYSGCGGAANCLLSELMALYCPGSRPSIVPLLTTMLTFWTSSGRGQTGFGHRIRSFILTSYALLASMAQKPGQCGHTSGNVRLCEQARVLAGLSISTLSPSA